MWYNLEVDKRKEKPMSVSQSIATTKPALLAAKEEKRLGIHSFHRYYGKLIPAIPRAYIRLFSKENDLICDMFAGSGTTAVEAANLNRDFLGVEINPLCESIVRAKLGNYDVSVLDKIANNLKVLVENDRSEVKECEIPFVINRDHWFKEFVQKQLVVIERNFEKALTELKIKSRDYDIYQNFLAVTLSAIVKQVSNADTMHVFPGRSKRMRRLEAEGKISIDVNKTFFNALCKRIKYIKEFGAHNNSNKILLADSSSVDLSAYKGKVRLVVTNPPYISSVRYAETLKLELYWTQRVKNSEEYTKLSTSMIGNDRIEKSKVDDITYLGIDSVDKIIDTLSAIDKKQAKVVSDYFTLMEKVIKNMQLVLQANGKVVMKIADSKIRKVTVKTGYLLADIANKHGFETVEIFNDKINSNSRSLLTARNTYSDIILEDNIVIWKKKS